GKGVVQDADFREAPAVRVACVGQELLRSRNILSNASLRSSIARHPRVHERARQTLYRTEPAVDEVPPIDTQAARLSAAALVELRAAGVEWEEVHSEYRSHVKVGALLELVDEISRVVVWIPVERINQEQVQRRGRVLDRKRVDGLHAGFVLAPIRFA